ncbi:MAG: lecithin retinol acyltransferase family protein [Anaeroplasmataceae bacterium]
MWVNKKPVYGDHIKVDRGLYSHHGIYVSDDCVIQFASLIPGRETDPESASICETSLEQFLKGQELLVREYTEDEALKKRSPQDIVAYAKSKLGTKGYDIINNNCEHFANECVFGEKRSEQVDNIMSLLSSFFR